MTVYPDVFRKAQAEIDTVLGFERLPELEDRDKLPYIECIVSEVLRYVIFVRDDRRILLTLFKLGKCCPSRSVYNFRTSASC